MALAGPASSLLLAGLFASLRQSTSGSIPLLHALALWLARINLMLAMFNLIPSFPLDGGRVFRAIVWGSTGDIRRATRWAAGFGQLIAFGFIFVGIWQVFSGAWSDGLWVAFIGWFLNSAAVGSRQEAAVREMLKGHRVREVAMTDCPHLLPHLTLDVVVEHVVLRSGRRCFPVVEDDQFIGLLTLHNIREVPRARWPLTRVEEAMIPLGRLKTVRPDDELATVLGRMTQEDINQYPVMEHGQFLGMIARDSLLNSLQALERPT